MCVLVYCLCPCPCPCHYPCPRHCHVCPHPCHCPCHCLAHSFSLSLSHSLSRCTSVSVSPSGSLALSVSPCLCVSQSLCGMIRPIARANMPRPKACCELLQAHCACTQQSEQVSFAICLCVETSRGTKGPSTRHTSACAWGKRVSRAMGLGGGGRGPGPACGNRKTSWCVTVGHG